MVPALGVHFFSEINDGADSFLGVIFSFVGEIVIFFFDISFCSSFLFIMASLELVLTGLFLGDGLMISSDLLPLCWGFNGLHLLLGAESVVLLVLMVSSEPLRAC